MNGLTSYILSKKYVDDSLQGAGALKGKDGKDGKSAYEIAKSNGFTGTESEWLESLKGTDGKDFKYSDFTPEQLESLKVKGDSGVSPTITENADNTDKIYKLDIETADGKFTTPNLKGADGQGGGTADVPIEKIKVNGELQTPVNKVVDITVPDAYDDTDIREELANKADITAIPSKVSVLENDSKYQTESDVTTTLTDYATKTYVGEQITNAEHLKREIVTVLPSDTEASDNIIYMLKVESATGNDKYQEYMKIDGTVQMVGDTSVDLTDYAKSVDIPTTVAELSDSADYAKKTDVNNSISTLQTDKADASDLTAHTDDADIHVTAENKATWNTVSDKVDKEEGKGLSANDYTNEEKALVGTIKDKINKTSIATALDDTVTDEQVTSALLAKTELDKKIDKTSIATTLSSESTNDEVVGAKLAYDELKKAELANKEQFATARGDYITVNDSVDGNIVDLKLYGKSEQKQYTGKNLLNATLQTQTINGITFTNNGDGTYNVTGTSTIKGEYEFGKITLSAGNYKLLGFPGNGVLNEYCLYTYSGTTFPNDIGKGATFTVSDTLTTYIRLAVPNETTVNMLIKPMIVDASLYPDATYDDFEPYVGGIPAPSPSYPQEIKSVVNPVVKVCGKNLLNPGYHCSGQERYGISVVENSDGSITINGTTTSVAYINFKFGTSLSNYHKVKKGKYTLSVNGESLSNIAVCVDLYNTSYRSVLGSGYITFETDVDYVNALYLKIPEGITFNNNKYYPQLEIGDTATPYEPYTEQTATLPYTLNAIPVESGGNVTIDGQEYISDYVDFENKKLVRRVKKKDLGEFDWNYVYNVNPKLKYFDTTILDSFKPTASHPIGEGFCDSYSVEKNNIPQSDLANNKVAIGWLNTSSTRCCLEIRDDNYTNALDFKNAVKGRYIYYQLATQETIDLTDEQVQVFKELQTYYPTTNVFVTSDQLNGYADVKYPTTDVSGIVSNHDVEIEKLKKADTENFNALEQDIENQFSTASGDYITVNDSVDGNIIELGVKGNSFQQTYSGKNLLSKTNISYNATGLTITDNKNGTYSITSGTTTGTEFRLIGAYNNLTKEIHLDTSKTYKFTAKIGSANLSTICVFTDGSTYTNVNSTQSSFTLPDGFEDISSIFIRFDSSASYSGTLEVMLYEYTEGIDETFEPYVGGIPSPNPNYPQTINSVGDDGSLVVKSCGKNLAKNANLSTSLTSREVTFVTKSDGTIVVNGTPTQATDNWVWCTGNSNFLLRKGKYLWTGCPTNDGSNKYRLLLRNVEKPWKENNDYGNGVTFELTEDKAFCFFVGISYGYVANNLTFKPMLRRCDDNWIPYGDDLYEPYHETTTTIPLSEPLRSIGDVKDEITYQDGKWGVLRRIKEINLSDLSWNLVNNDKYQYWSYSVNDGKEASSYNTIANIIAEKYMASSWYNTVQLNSATNAIAYGFNANNTSSKLVAVHNGSTTESPTGKFLYELVTPTFEPFADQTLPYLSTYDGVTNISNDDALSAEMTVKYPITDASGVGSRNESGIAELAKNTDDKFDDVNESLAVVGKCKNLLNPTLQTTTKNGVTCTNNGDGTYTINGTATENTEFILYGSSTLVELNKEFRLTGCPNNTDAYLFVGDWGNPWTLYGKDKGNGSNFKITTSSPDKRVAINVPKGVTGDNIVFKPMLTTNLNATYDDFVPYTGDGDTLTHDVADLKNDLVPKKIELQNVDERVTIQDNGSFIINGFAFVNLLVTFNETLPQWSNFVRLPRPKGGNVTVNCENSVKLTIYSQDNLPGDCGTYDIVQSGTEIRLLVNYEVA